MTSLPKMNSAHRVTVSVKLCRCAVLQASVTLMPKRCSFTHSSVAQQSLASSCCQPQHDCGSLLSIASTTNTHEPHSPAGSNMRDICRWRLLQRAHAILSDNLYHVCVQAWSLFAGRMYAARSSSKRRILEAAPPDEDRTRCGSTAERTE